LDAYWNELRYIEKLHLALAWHCLWHHPQSHPGMAWAGNSDWSPFPQALERKLPRVCSLLHCLLYATRWIEIQGLVSQCHIHVHLVSCQDCRARRYGDLPRQKSRTRWIRPSLWHDSKGYCVGSIWHDFPWKWIPLIKVSEPCIPFFPLFGDRNICSTRNNTPTAMGDNCV